MEKYEEMEESYRIMNHLRSKLNTFPKLYWMETKLNLPRIEFDINIWYSCQHCTCCNAIHLLLQEYHHPYFRIKENYQNIILYKIQTPYEKMYREKYGIFF